MCKGPNEPGGPRRCAGHARENLEQARAASQEATAAVAENAGHLRGYQDTLDDVLGDAANASNRRRRLEDEGAPQEEIAAADAEMRAHEQLASQLERENTERKQNHPRLERKAAATSEHLQKRQAEYDQTDQGLIDLQHEVVEAEAHMWSNYENASDAERRADEQCFHALRARQDAAERIAYSAASQRQGYWDGDAEQQEHYHALADANQEIAASRELEANAASEEDRRNARTAREHAEGFRQKLRERERAHNAVFPHLSAVHGDTTDEERERWGQVVSGHRRNIDTKTGQPTFEVTIDRQAHGGTRHKAKVEIAESDFTPELLDAYRREMPQITRMPSTSEVMRWAEKRHSKVRDVSRRDFLASGGTAADWDAGQRAKKALEQLSLA